MLACWLPPPTLPPLEGGGAVNGCAGGDGEGCFGADAGAADAALGAAACGASMWPRQMPLSNDHFPQPATVHLVDMAKLQTAARTLCRVEMPSSGGPGIRLCSLGWRQVVRPRALAGGASGNGTYGTGAVLQQSMRVIQASSPAHTFSRLITHVAHPQHLSQTILGGAAAVTQCSESLHFFRKCDF